MRSTFITQDALEKVMDYWELRVDTDSHIFVSHAKNRLSTGMSRNAVEDIIRKYKLLC